MKRFISIILIALLLLSSCEKSDNSEIALPKDDTAEVAGDLSQENTQQEPEKNENAQTDQKPEKEQSTQTETPETDIPKTQAPETDETETPKENTTDNGAVQLPAAAITLIKSDVGYVSDDESANELRKILENGKYTEKHCGCKNPYRVYFDSTTTCKYTIYECESLETVHIKSEKGEYRPDRETSIEIISLLKEITSSDNKLDGMGENFFENYDPPGFINLQKTKYIVKTYAKDGTSTCSTFESKKLESLLDQIKFDLPFKDSGLQHYPKDHISIAIEGSYEVHGTLDGKKPYLVYGDTYSFLSDELTKAIREEIEKQHADIHPVQVEYYHNMSYYEFYQFGNDDSKALRSFLESLPYDTHTCRCEADVKIDFADIENPDTYSGYRDFYIVFDRDSENVHVKNNSGATKLTKKQRDTLTEILVRQLTIENRRGSGNIDYGFIFDRLNMTVTKDGKTATPNEDALNTLGYIFRTVGYAGEQCDCGKKYAVIDTVDGQYSFCTCDDPKIESACGTHRIDKDSLERLKTTVDAMFE